MMGLEYRLVFRQHLLPWNILLPAASSWTSQVGGGPAAVRLAPQNLWPHSAKERFSANVLAVFLSPQKPTNKKIPSTAISVLFENWLESHFSFVPVLHNLGDPSCTLQNKRYVRYYAPLCLSVKLQTPFCPPSILDYKTGRDLQLDYIASILS